ncbi:hypothetical protein Shyd_21440 [Streptomyces hydrogenans]|uniref:Uncharacterized protein n=1 Tax=Streptomyces hydrogenans TaxID=1873719 RepID=A0ABQ3P6X4_9ACTN|nr:hypothetical protein GCM10018784_13280 [Streptomyces hydrogenans]GHI20773.1 hypothetical protein Shyd_21440 [Streptomyces hydrogenans]
MLIRATATASAADQILIPPDVDGVLPAVSRPERPREQGWRARVVVKIYHGVGGDRRSWMWRAPQKEGCERDSRRQSARSDNEFVIRI